MLIEVGDWLHVQPRELSCERITPTQLNEYKNRVQEPFLRLMVGEDREVMVNGKKMFWALLDALFPYDKLPRKPVNEFLQHEPNEFLHDLNSFFDESNTPYISIMLGEVADPYSTVGKKWENPGATIITANTGLQAPDCVAIADSYNGLVIPGTWKDTKGSHEVPCVLIDGCVHVADLGNKFAVGSVFQNEHGNNVRPLPLSIVKKGVGWPSVLASIVLKHSEAHKEAEGRIYPPTNARNGALTSSEQAAGEHDLFLRGHQ